MKILKIKGVNPFKTWSQLYVLNGLLPTQNEKVDIKLARPKVTLHRLLHLACAEHLCQRDSYFCAAPSERHFSLINLFDRMTARYASTSAIASSTSTATRREHPGSCMVTPIN